MKTVTSTHTLVQESMAFNVFDDVDAREVATNLASEMGLRDWTATFVHTQTRLNTTFEVWSITGMMEIRRTKGLSR